MGQSYKMGEITLLLADRFPLFSSGLQHLLLAEKGIMRVDVADGRKEVMQYLHVFKYDILLMDTRLPDSERNQHSCCLCLDKTMWVAHLLQHRLLP